MSLNFDYCDDENEDDTNRINKLLKKLKKLQELKGTRTIGGQNGR